MAELWESEIVENDEYYCFASKVRGLSHTKAGSDCQDWFGVETAGDCIIAVVADGHGSDKHPLSRFGAEMAVNCSRTALKLLCREFGNDVDALYDAATKKFPAMLYKDWTECAKANFYMKLGDEAGTFEHGDIYKKYGTTAMFGIAARKTLIFGILDGNVVVVNDGHAEEPIREDDGLIGSEARSLCKERDALNAWRFCRVENADWAIISTDGLRNAFGEDDDNALFLSAAAEICAFTQKNGLQASKAALPAFLERCTNEGSGDDITVCCFARRDKEYA